MHCKSSVSKRVLSILPELQVTVNVAKQISLFDECLKRHGLFKESKEFLTVILTKKASRIRKVVTGQLLTQSVLLEKASSAKKSRVLF